MNLEALWHDLECAGYREDLPLWRSLAAQCGGPVLDVGAGTGRVALELAADGVPVVAMDVEATLLASLGHRAAGLPVETACADARSFALARRFSLVLVPMQTLQLLGGTDGRAAFLRRALAHLEPGGLLAAAVADPMGCFDDVHALPPPPAACWVADVRYSSQLRSVAGDGGRAAIHRRREVRGPDGLLTAEDVVLQLDRVTAPDVAREAAALGFVVEPCREVEGDDVVTGARQLERYPPGPGADVEHRPAGGGRQLAPELEVLGIGAALEVVPERERAHVNDPVVTPRRASRSRSSSIAV